MKKCLISFLMLYIILFCSTIFPQWQQQTNGLQLWGLGEAVDACDSNTAIIAVDNILYKTEDAGNNWEIITYPSVGNGRAVDVSITDKDHFWITTDTGGILETSDGGMNWTIQFYDTTITPFMDYIKMFDLNNGVAMGDSKNTKVPIGPAIFLRTEDGGKNWISVNDSAFGGFSGDEWRRVDFVNKNVGYFRESGSLPQKLFKTINGGNNWLRTNFPYDDGVLVKFYNEDLGLVVNMKWDGSLFTLQMCRTTDGGNSWETFNIDSEAWPTDIEFIPGNPSKVWYVDLDSLYFSSDNGRTWTGQKIYNGKLLGRDLKFTDSMHGWLLCDNGKVFYTSNNGGIITGIASNKNQIPNEYFLQQNYPNPFNPATNIRYQIKELSHVTLKVYDVLGKEITQLVNSDEAPGNYEIEFNAGNLPSGIYFYRLTANNFSDTRKMIIMR